VQSISRWDFLKLSASGLAGLYLSSLPLDFERLGSETSDLLGRIAKDKVKLFDSASTS
jgi:hypothetical protein